MKTISLLIIFLIGPFAYTAFADLPLSPAQLEQVQTELRERGITEAELLARLKEKGVDLENIPPEELPSYQAIIMDTVNELEAEKRSGDRGEEPVQQEIIVRTVQPEMAALGGDSLPAGQGDDQVSEGIITGSEELTPEEERALTYGHALFTGRDMNVFRTTEGARAPDTYILGPGDQIRITIFGASQTDLLLEINSEGYIQPYDTPQIYLKGLSIAEARRLLTDRLAQFYTFRPDQFALTIQTARTITVNVFGESRQRGSFTLSALNTAFNALAAAGGPADIGSVRNIQHIRGNERKVLDVYAFMHDPGIQFDFDLQHNDIIYIPLAHKVVRISGAVKRPMRYELTDGENLRHLIEYAGGINYNAYPDFLQIERIDEGEVSLTEYSLADALRGDITIDLQDGDIVRLRQTEKPLENFVEVDGAVYYSGRYDLRRSPDLQVLVEKAELREQAYVELVFVERVQPDESIRIIPVYYEELVNGDEVFELMPRDRVLVFNQQRYRSLASISVTGQVRDEIERSMHYDERLSLAHALSLAGGALPTAAELAYVIRTNLMNPDLVQHIPVHLVNDHDFQLQPGDQLFVYSRQTYTNIPQISVQGAVNNPFATTFEPNLGITDLLTMAGGLTEAAALNRVDVFRLQLTASEGTKFDRISLQVDEDLNLSDAFADFQMMPYDQVVVRQIPMFDTSRSIQISGEVMYPGAYPLETRLVHLSELIEEAGGLTPQADQRHATLIRSFEGTGPVGINLEKAMQQRYTERHDPIIMPGDIITIPHDHNVVSIRIEATRLGELERRDLIVDTEFVPGTQDEVVTFVYQGSRSARWYIENFAGGFAAEADKRSVTVTRRNGQMQGTKQRMLVFNKYPTVTPGSTIALTYEPPPDPAEEGESIDWDRVYARTLSGVTTILTLLVLLDRVAN